MGGLPTLVCGLVDCYCKAPVSYSISSIPLYLRWIQVFSDCFSQVYGSSVMLKQESGRRWQNGVDGDFWSLPDQMSETLC